MKIKHIFSLAALSIMMAACSSDESTQSQPAPSGKTVPFKTVITAGNPDTRGLTEASDGKSITAKWEKEEKVALIHGKTIDVLEVASVDADGNATITGTINNAVNGEKVYLVYVGHQHVSMANYVEYWTNWKTKNPDTDIPASDLSHPVFELMATQSGTLEGIQDSLDFRYSPAGDQAAKMVVSDDGATLADNVKLLTKYSIWKLNLTTNGTTALKASKFVMTDASENQYTVDLGESTASEFYLAFLPDSNTGYSFEATAGDKTYTCTPTISSALADGKFYTSTLTMTESGSGGQYLVYDEEGMPAAIDIPTTATTITSSTTEWTEGTYVVSSDVTIAGNVILSGDVDLILMDGVKLTVNGNINSKEENDKPLYSLNIFGQAEGTGELSANSGGIVLHTKDLNIHGGVINISSDNEESQGVETYGTFNIYHGTITTQADMNGIMALGKMNVYNGKLTASSSTGSAISLYLESSNEEGGLTIMGGTVIATSTADYGCGIEANSDITISGGIVNATGGGGEGIFAGGEGLKITITDGTVTSKATKGIGLEASKIIIEDGEVTATGGTSDSGTGLAGIDGALTVNGGIVTATGGDKSGEGEYGLGISGTIDLGSGIKLYEGDSANPTTLAESQEECTMRYAIVK